MRWCNKAYMFYYHHFNPQFNPQFNPRTHMGCDNVGTFSSSDDGFISIHAPTWGATRLDKRGSSSDKFQSTHPHGVRPADSVGISALTRFQSTHPHGVRLFAQVTIKDYVFNFNPRTHMGCKVPKANNSARYSKRQMPLKCWVFDP